MGWLTNAFESGRAKKRRAGQRECYAVLNRKEYMH